MTLAMSLYTDNEDTFAATEIVRDTVAGANLPVQQR